MQVGEAAIVDLRLTGSLIIEADSVYGTSRGASSSQDAMPPVAGQAVRYQDTGSEAIQYSSSLPPLAATSSTVVPLARSHLSSNRESPYFVHCSLQLYDFQQRPIPTSTRTQWDAIMQIIKHVHKYCCMSLIVDRLGIAPVAGSSHTMLFKETESHHVFCKRDLSQTDQTTGRFSSKFHMMIDAC